MKSRFFDADVARAYGLIIGIVLGSLALDLSGAAAGAPDRPSAAVQSAPRAAGVAAPAGSPSIRNR